MLYEQACRLTESVAKNLRRSWGVSNNANDLKDVKEGESC